MNGTTISITSTPPVPTVVQGDSAAGVSRARQVARAFTDRLTPAPDPAVAHTLVLMVPSSSPTPCATAEAPSASA